MFRLRPNPGSLVAKVCPQDSQCLSNITGATDSMAPSARHVEDQGPQQEDNWGPGVPDDRINVDLGQDLGQGNGNGELDSPAAPYHFIDSA